MNDRAMTLAEVNRAGLSALARELGPVGMVRFLQQFEVGAGDYSTERHAWLDADDPASVAESIRRRRASRSAQ